MKFNFTHKVVLVVVVFFSSIGITKTRIQMNVEGMQGKIEFRVPTQTVLGFNNEPKNIKEKRKLFELIGFFESKITKIITFDKAMECLMTKDHIGLANDAYDKAANSDQVQKIKSEFSAIFSIECKKDLAGAQVVLDLTAKKQIKELAITLQIGENINKKFNSKNKVTTFELK